MHCSLFNDAASKSGYNASNIWNKECIRKQSWPNLTYHPEIPLDGEGLRKITKTSVWVFGVQAETGNRKLPIACHKCHSLRKIIDE
jgi:hypothetical protein